MGPESAPHACPAHPSPSLLLWKYPQQDQEPLDPRYFLKCFMAETLRLEKETQLAKVTRLNDDDTTYGGN